MKASETFLLNLNDLFLGDPADLDSHVNRRPTSVRGACFIPHSGRNKMVSDNSIK